jgi:hypothetical protein
MRLHRKSKPVITGLALVLLFSSLSFKCSDGPANDPNRQFRTAAKASDDIAQGISQLIDLKRKLAQQGKMSAAEESVITDLLLKVNTADKVFVAQIKMLTAAPDANARANLATLFAQVTSALAELNSKGLLPLGNAGAKSQLAKILEIATTAAQIIETFLKP